MTVTDRHPAETHIQTTYVWMTLGFFMPLFALYGIYNCSPPARPRPDPGSNRMPNTRSAWWQ